MTKGQQKNFQTLALHFNEAGYLNKSQDGTVKAFDDSWILGKRTNNKRTWLGIEQGQWHDWIDWFPLTNAEKLLTR